MQKHCVFINKALQYRTALINYNEGESLLSSQLANKSSQEMVTLPLCNFYNGILNCAYKCLLNEQSHNRTNQLLTCWLLFFVLALQLFHARDKKYNRNRL